MPVEVADWNDLDNVRNDLFGDYILVNDLDSETAGYSGVGDDFEPIGSSNDFEGTFNGDGFAIEDLVVDIAQDYVGLFSRVNNSDSLIENLSVSGSVSDNGADDLYVGGLVGGLRSGSIENCVSHVDVTATGDRVGGLVGLNQGQIKDSYATGSVHGDQYVGGLVGVNLSLIETSYAVGQVTGNTNVGGLSNGFLFFGGDYVDSYWDTQSTGQSTSAGGTGLTTSEMQGSEAESNMSGFDFSATWSSVLESDDDTTADGYPILDSPDRENQLEAQGIFDEVETGGPELATATPVSSSSYPVSSTATTASQSEASPVAAVGTSSSGSPITASTTQTFTTTATASPVKSGGIGTATSTATTASGFATPILGIGSYEFVTVASASTVSGSLSPATSVGIGVTEAGSSVSTAFSTAQTAGSVTESAVSGGITPISADVAVVSPETASMASGSPISTETAPITVNGLAGSVSGAISTPVAGFSSVSGAETASMSLAGVTEATGTPRFESVVGESEVRAQAFRAIGVGLPETAQGMGVSEVEASVSSAFSESLTPDLALGLRSKASVVPAFSTIQSAGAESVAVAGSSAVSAVSMPVTGIVETSSVSSAIPVYASVVGETATATAWAVSTGSETFVVATPLLGSGVLRQDVFGELSEALASPLVARKLVTVRRSRPEGSENRAAFGSSRNFADVKERY